MNCSTEETKKMKWNGKYGDKTMWHVFSDDFNESFILLWIVSDWTKDLECNGGGISQPLNCCQLKITFKLFCFLIYKTLWVLMFNYLGEGKIAEKKMILSGIFSCPFPNLQFQLPTLPSFVQSSTPPSTNLHKKRKQILWATLTVY